MNNERPSANPMPAAVPNDATNEAPYRVTLPEFEGPLDLLLHLCQTHELDILNISVSFIAEKYIEYLEVMQDMSVEVAADYLVMAAHLAYLKSRELVPSPEPLEVSEDGEEPIDPREELIRRLLEYQKYKNAAESLGNRPIEGRNVFVRGAPIEVTSEAGLAEHSVWKLLEHWAQILEKAKPQYTHDVVVDRMSIADRVNQIVDLLESGKGMVRFEDLLGDDLPEAELRHKIVVSLLAVLELARLRVIRILQQVDTGNFFLAQTDDANLAEARHLYVTSAKENEPIKTAAAPIEQQIPVDTAPLDEQIPVDAAPLDEQIPVDTAPLDEQIPVDTAPLDEQIPVDAAPAEEPILTDAAPLDEQIPVDATPLDEQIPGNTALVGEQIAAEDVPAEPTAEVLPAEEPAIQAETEIENLASDTARLVPQEDVISAPSPASAEKGEEVIDGQTQEEQKTTEE
jgi:segregation and condensation protein A